MTFQMVQVKVSVGKVRDGFKPSLTLRNPWSVEATGETVMRKLTPVLGLILFSILIIAIGCTGDQGPAGSQGEQGPQGIEGPTGPPAPHGDPLAPLVATGAAIDVHTHLLSAEHVVSAYGAPAGTPASDAEDLINRLDEANVERAVVLSTAYKARTGAGVSGENDWVAGEIAKFPDRLIGLCGINPLVENALGEIDRCLDLPGMLGIKLHLPASGVDVTNDDHVVALSAVFDKIQDMDVPILMHVGVSPGLPLDADGLANLATIIAAHPEVRVVHAHCAGDTDDQRIELWLQGMVSTPPVFSPENFYLEVSACMKFYKDAPLAKRELMVWRLKKWGLERVFFGSDYLQISPVETPKEALQTLSKYPFTQEEIDLILGNDASAWLGQ